MFGAEVQFIGVSGRDELASMQAFVDDLGVGAFEHIADIDGDVWQRFGITGQPAFVFVNDDGTLDPHLGALGLDGIEARVEGLLAS